MKLTVSNLINLLGSSWELLAVAGICRELKRRLTPDFRFCEEKMNFWPQKPQCWMKVFLFYGKRISPRFILAKKPQCWMSSFRLFWERERNVAERSCDSAADISGFQGLVSSSSFMSLSTASGFFSYVHHHHHRVSLHFNEHLRFC